MRTSRLLIVLVLALAANSTSALGQRNAAAGAQRGAGGRSNGTNYDGMARRNADPTKIHTGWRSGFSGIKVDQYSGRDSIVCRSYA